MASGAAEVVVRSLRAALAGVADGDHIPDAEPLRAALGGLECYLPEVLAGGRGGGAESLDGLVPVIARKVGDAGAALLGLCVLSADQTLAPFHLRLVLAPHGGAVVWLECRVGEVGAGGGMVRVPHSDLPRAAKRLRTLLGPDAIEWAFAVEFGDVPP